MERGGGGGRTKVEGLGVNRRRSAREREKLLERLVEGIQRPPQYNNHNNKQDG